MSKKGGEAMATIRTTIQVQDRMSQAFRSMNSAMQTVIGSFEHLQRTSSNAVDTAAIQSARRELELAESAFNDIEEEIRRADEQQQRLNDSMRDGANFANDLMKKVIGIASAYGAFNWFKSGFDRLMSIDTATAKLQALGHNAQSVEMIMNDSLNSVRGTAFGLDEAVNTAASAVAAGIKPGQQLERYLSLTADAAALAGTNMSDMGAIFNKVTTSGKIQAEELNQISDRGIPIFQMLADEIGVTATEIRKLASDGKISANTFLNAVESGFGGAAQIMGTASFQATLDNIGSSISRIAANFLNGAGEGQGFFDQVKPLMVDLLDTLKEFEDKAMEAGQKIGQAFMNTYNVVSASARVVIDNWSLIAPVIYGIITALGLYTTALLILKTIQGITTLMHTAQAIAIAVKTGATIAETAATHNLTVAQWALNSALLASPITWIIAAIIALVVIIYLAVAAINKFAGTSISATGLIAGAFAVLGAFMFNIVVGVINAIIQFLWTGFVEPWIGIIEWVLNVFNGGFNSFGDAVANLLGQIISWFLSLGKVVTKIIDAIFGTNWTAGLSSLQGSVLAWGKNEKAITLDRSAPVIDTRIKYGDAWDAGNSWGSNLFKSKNSDDDKKSAGDEIKGSYSGADGIKDSLKGMDGIKNAVKNTGKSGKDTAGNTKKMAESMDMAEEDLKYLRDLAEREVINRFTTAEIKVDMSGMSNNINNEMDLDGVVSYLEEKVYETMTIAAEGDHD
ncbi:hypothetical protein CHH80_10820 [Bacillus sp. 7504-2]|nr:hypothetical protein CHH80_10820 [Bacillus sp. 7504-2]